MIRITQNAKIIQYIQLLSDYRDYDAYPNKHALNLEYVRYVYVLSM